MAVISIKEAKNLEGKRVMVRVDFNVPIENGMVADDSRLVASLPTIRYLLEQQAKIVLVTHIGRPDGHVVDELRVQPVVDRLSELLGQTVSLSPYNPTQPPLIGEESSITMLENIRFYPGEEANDPVFAKELASLADIFVLDGFAVAHRAAASVVGVAELLPSYAGLLLAKEIEGLSNIMHEPAHPFALVIGGIKSETKLPVIAHLLPLVDRVLLGGGLTSTYFLSLGYDVGASLVDTDQLEDVKRLRDSEKMMVPVDVVVGTKDGSVHRIVDILPEPHEICTDKEAIFDIGPKTTELFVDAVKNAKTIVWNGACGFFEQPPYNAGTIAVAHALKDVDAYSVVGGGETVQAVEAFGAPDRIDLVSTGGGAMLEFLSGKTLPGIAALEQSTQ